MIHNSAVHTLVQHGTQTVVLRELAKLDLQKLDLNEILVESAMRGHEMVVKLLLEYGAEVEAKN